MFNLYDEADPPKERACSRYMMNRTRQNDSPNEGACRQMRDTFKIYDESESPNEGACFR